jgi:hypothetical protein
MPSDVYDNSTLGQAEAVGGAVQTTTKVCLGTAAVATAAVSFAGAMEAASMTGELNFTAHGLLRANERNISNLAIKATLRFGTRGLNTGGGGSRIVSFLTTARYYIPVSVTAGSSPEVKDYVLNVIRNIWTGQIVTTFLNTPPN